MAGSAVGGSRTPGFSLTPHLILAEADALNDAGDELRTVTKPLRGLPGGSAAVFGTNQAALMHAEFLVRWKAEMSVQADSLDELAGRVRQSAVNYVTMDQAGAPKTPASDDLPNFLLGPVAQSLNDLTSFPDK